MKKSDRALEGWVEYVGADGLSRDPLVISRDGSFHWRVDPAPQEALLVVRLMDVARKSSRPLLTRERLLHPQALTEVDDLVINLR